MLKNIRLHIEKDEEKQAELDNELASQILENRKNNINAFRRNIPSLSPLIQGLNLTNYSVFMNKFSEPNIVDWGAPFMDSTPKTRFSNSLMTIRNIVLKYLLNKMKETLAKHATRLLDRA
jgi:hypothetical protein